MSTFQLSLTKYLYGYGSRLSRNRMGQQRYLIVSIVALVALLLASAVIAQASANFALACQTTIANAGGVVTSSHYGVISALGVPLAPGTDGSPSPTYSIRSSSFGLRVGFLPGYPTGQAAATSKATSKATIAASNQLTLSQFLPVIFGNFAVGLLGTCG